ncbi:MAG TPA: ATP-binding protein, partial [Ktedonobacteraceae bacterium]|nr:ATP-binding protein [Ktedonobacteraceae bacterium]
MPKTINRSIELQTLLTQLNLGAMADGFADVALRAAKEGLSHEAYLYELARLETEQRTQRRTARLVRASGLPMEKTFRTLALSRLSPSLQLQLERLKNASFLETATNMVLTQENVEGKLEEVDLTEKGSRPCPKSKKLLHENLSKKRYNWYDR